MEKDWVKLKNQATNGDREKVSLQWKVRNKEKLKQNSQRGGENLRAKELEEKREKT